VTDPLCYGARLDAARLGRLLDHVFQSNLRAQERGQAGTPVCIWGTHGLGKTALVQDYAREHNWRFAYCAPAQFEEMGDLHGLPTLMQAEGAGPKGRAYTVFAPPAWVPREEGPGILLLDDLNRADDRILRGLMQLLQNFEMFSWSLPPRWQIVATANPEGGDYSVTPMDDAMLTRLLHATLVFDAKAWAAWATREGVDPRGVSFVLTYPEAAVGRRTTPRSLAQFFAQIRGIADLKASADLVHALAMSSLDEATAASFMSFVADNLSELIDPDEILDADDFGPVAARVERLAGSKGSRRRVDRLSTVCTRLSLALTQSGYAPGPRHADNLVAFLTLKALPNDLRVAVHRELLAQGSEAVRLMLRDKRLAALMLAGM
jgi:hypothetical protein